MVDTAPESRFPRHVAIIMDGNGRWAKKRFLPRTFGHKAGASATKRVISEASRLNIGYLTLYAFSSENWKRPIFEVTELMKLLRAYLIKELEFLQSLNVKVRFIGERAGLSPEILSLMDEVSEKTMNNTGTVLAIALNYGSRAEMIKAVRKTVENGADISAMTDDELSALFESHLMTSGMPDPDLVIRTSGEQRISNFLLWQSAYTEFVFSQILWPDFKENDFRDAVYAYAKRERRYGSL